ncbi:D-amino acid oxidase [Ostreococcus tauri]|uniref:D-amino acid oxidase n=1 Tax=Ostreococcus tauri TaxID=70448 RepID=A0A1Y5I976_OSTTA|nr:D-amino acid oxidase [Ostreococcus tauri]
MRARSSSRTRPESTRGAGVVGLHCALALIESGKFSSVRVVAEKTNEGTTSAVAAAFWYPFLTKTSPEEMSDRWAIESLRWYEEVERSDREAKTQSSGVEIRRFKFYLREQKEKPAWAAALMHHRELEVGEYDESRYAGGFEFDAPVAAMSTFLPWLLERCERAGVQFDWRKISSVEDVVRDSDDVGVVVNCAGLGARELVNDQEVVPIRGQVLYTTQDCGQGYFDDNPERLGYIIPRRDVTVLGGTATRGDERTEVDEGDTASIFEKCQDLFPELDASKIIGANVGLRPSRNVVRCELDEPLSRGARLIHCYGHGGAGMTLARGSALEVLRLALEAA